MTDQNKSMQRRSTATQVEVSWEKDQPKVSVNCDAGSVADLEELGRFLTGFSRYPQLFSKVLAMRIEGGQHEALSVLRQVCKQMESINDGYSLELLSNSESWLSGQIPRSTSNLVDRPSTVVAGKFGELVQGVFRDGSKVRPSFVAGTISSGPYPLLATGVRQGMLTISSRPSRKLEKTQSVCRQFLVESGINPDEHGGSIVLVGGPPIGKGLGSSSVDMAAALQVLAQAFGLALPPREMFNLLCHEERSDPVTMASSLAQVFPEDGTLNVFGTQPQFLIVGWDTSPSKTVDTEEAGKLDAQRRKHLGEYHELFELVASQDTASILQASTRSAELNQHVLPKPHFEDAIVLARTHGCGLICAHSGTYLGFLLPKETELEVIGELRCHIRRWGYVPEYFLMG